MYWSLYEKMMKYHEQVAPQEAHKELLEDITPFPSQDDCMAILKKNKAYMIEYSHRTGKDHPLRQPMVNAYMRIIRKILKL